VSEEDLQKEFEALYRATRSRLLAYAVRRSAPEDVQDVVAETYLQAWRHLADLPTDDLAVLWLYGCARRVLANRRRGDQRRQALIERYGRQRLEPSQDPAPDHSALAARAALRGLVEADREVLMLTAWEGLSHRELAETLGCSPTAARIRLMRARRRLASALDEPRDEPSTADSPATPSRERKERMGCEPT